MLLRSVQSFVLCDENKKELLLLLTEKKKFDIMIPLYPFERKEKMKKKIAIVVLFALLFCLLVSCDSSSKEIREAVINEEGRLVITYTDGSQNILGVVVGADGKDGADGEKGDPGEKGEPGEKGDTGLAGANGAQGTPGKAGKEIADISVTPEGNLLVSYDDSTEDTVELIGKLYLFGGYCGDSAAWAVYNGGILYIGGTGTVEYAVGDAPWSPLVSMLAGCYVDTSQGLTLGNETLAGIDPDIIYYPDSQTETYVWVDMTVSANLYSSASAEGIPVATLPLGTKLQVLGTEGDFYLVA